MKNMAKAHEALSTGIAGLTGAIIFFSALALFVCPVGGGSGGTSLTAAF